MKIYAVIILLFCLAVTSICAAEEFASFQQALNAGNKLYAARKYDDAAPAFQRAAELAKTSSQKISALMQLGHCRLRTGKPEPARAAYEQALQVEQARPGEKSRAQLYIGTTYRNQKNLAQAQIEFQKVLAIAGAGKGDIATAQKYLKDMAMSAKTDSLPQCPKTIPQEWLAPQNHPRVHCTPSELAEAQMVVKETAWGKKYLEQQHRLCRRFIGMSDKELQALVPPPQCKIIYGLGMNLDPVNGERMLWAGWEKPWSVKDTKGTLYPNKDWLDTGDGVVDPKSKKRFYFRAQAYGHVIEQLEQKILPALADVYALTGSAEHAHAAAVLLDAIAHIYPTNRRGPMDYPTSPGDYDRGGRLDRPYYQTARGLMNYLSVVDLLAPSGELEKPSLRTKEKTMRENVIRNLMWDGAAYCLYWTRRGYQLHNGHADYMRGAAYVGLLLEQRDFVAPMLEGPLSMPAMLEMNVDRNGFYHELSASYADHARQLYVTIAELFEAARYLGWKDAESVYARPAMQLFLEESFNRLEVGGHMPAIGDDGPDRFVNSPMRRRPQGRYVHSDRFLKSQIASAWILLVRGAEEKTRERARQLLADSFGTDEKAEPPVERWAVYHITRAQAEAVQKIKADFSRFETAAVFYGAKGFALLRGGKGEKRYGAQLFFGPVHNHGQKEALTWLFYGRGAEWSYDPGYFNTHYRFGWTTTSVAHQAMVVNQKSYDPTIGGGCLSAWLVTPEVQWAMVSHPTAYKSEGVSRYERLIAQAHNPDTGELGYWLDIGRVAGGQTRDDSFHTQMRGAALDAALPPADADRPSLFGDKNLGCIIRNDYRLQGEEFDKQPFYWTPPGEGYGFLGNPRETEMSGTVRTTLSNPGFAKQVEAVIIADLPGAQGRKLIFADGPKGRGILQAAYILRRDTGPGPSVFAKVIRLADSAEADHLQAVTVTDLSPVGNNQQTGLEYGLCVTWKNGRRDVWFVGGGQQATPCAITVDGLPRIETDAQVAVISFDQAGAPVFARASETTLLRIKGGPALTGPARIEARIRKVHLDGERAVFTVAWEAGAEATGKIKSGQCLLTMPEKGEASTWRINSVRGNEITCADVKPTMALTEFVSVKGKPGWYSLRTAVSRFFSSGGRPLSGYAVGRAVYRDGKLVARIAELAKDGRTVLLLADGRPAGLGARFSGALLEAGTNDRVIIPLNLTWRAAR